MRKLWSFTFIWSVLTSLGHAIKQDFHSEVTYSETSQFNPDFSDYFFDNSLLSKSNQEIFEQLGNEARQFKSKVEKDFQGTSLFPFFGAEANDDWIKQTQSDWIKQTQSDWIKQVQSDWMKHGETDWIKHADIDGLKFDFGLGGSSNPTPNTLDTNLRPEQGVQGPHEPSTVDPTEQKALRPASRTLTTSRPNTRKTRILSSTPRPPTNILSSTPRPPTNILSSTPRPQQTTQPRTVPSRPEGLVPRIPESTTNGNTVPAQDISSSSTKRPGFKITLNYPKKNNIETDEIKRDSRDFGFDDQDPFFLASTTSRPVEAEPNPTLLEPSSTPPTLVSQEISVPGRGLNYTDLLDTRGVEPTTPPLVSTSPPDQFSFFHAVPANKLQ